MQQATTMTQIDLLEGFGAVFGLVGAFLLATNTRVSRYGWWFFLCANVLILAFAVLINRYMLAFQQLGFMATSFLGLYRSGFFDFGGVPMSENAVTQQQQTEFKPASDVANDVVRKRVRAGLLELTEKVEADDPKMAQELRGMLDRK
jgi:hypothetical protein